MDNKILRAFTYETKISNHVGEYRIWHTDSIFQTSQDITCVKNFHDLTNWQLTWFLWHKSPNESNKNLYKMYKKISIQIQNFCVTFWHNFRKPWIIFYQDVKLLNSFFFSYKKKTKSPLHAIFFKKFSLSFSSFVFDRLCIESIK